MEKTVNPKIKAQIRFYKSLESRTWINLQVLNDLAHVRRGSATLFIIYLLLTMIPVFPGIPVLPVRPATPYSGK